MASATHGPPTIRVARAISTWSYPQAAISLPEQLRHALHRPPILPGILLPDAETSNAANQAR